MRRMQLEYEEYSVQYDRMTVDECRRVAHPNLDELKLTLKAKGDVDEGAVKRVAKAMTKLQLHQIKVRRYQQKAETIRGWMEEDARKDEFLRNAIPPDPIHCKKCKARMELQSRHLDYPHRLDDTVYRAKFHYKCPRGCIPNSTRYEDGSEWVYDPPKCPECSGDLELESVEIEDGVSLETERCTECDYVQVEEYESLSKIHEKDTEFETDRAKYCMGEEEGNRYIAQKLQLDSALKLMAKKLNERDDRRDL